MSYNTYDKLPDMLDFPKNEEEVISYWKRIDAFQTSLKQSQGKPRYAFYDGPPFATGLPHYGHILAGTIKDTITRFAHQNGFHVDRHFGWDCHGLPVEHEIDKLFSIKSAQDVMDLGIENYNKECRKIVTRYSTEWRNIITRLGRWIDFDNDYKTMYPSFMESVWWALKELYNKNLVYHGYRVMPCSTTCRTPLSNFEANQNYKEVVDPSVVVSFPLTDDPDTSFLAWTTTPWTLISNLALIVNSELVYVKLKVKSTSQKYILLESRVSEYFNVEDVVIEEKFKGEAIKGKTYVPLFEYFGDWREQGAFTVFTDDYVTESEGTGVVQSAPAFGEDDYRVSLKNGLYREGKTVPCPISDDGCFTARIQEYSGMYFKDTDKLILKRIKEMKRLFSNKTINHSYPFCWRSDTPLMYKMVPSWFVSVTSIVPDLLENNSKTYWVPSFVKEKRFTNWLENARDWNISRNRYWGTPIPLWTNEDFTEVVCVGSIEELYELSGVRIDDLHREFVDKIQIPSKKTPGTFLRRIPEVFDCWFESGSMPYAQMHYPFENKEKFDASFPANFIAEGIDQTRGWFYTLMVMSTALFNQPAFKNLIASGLVLASDGQKMSKRKKNYPDPTEVIDKYGADALRLYLIDSPVVRAENLRFKESGVRDMIKDVFLPWFNSFRYLTQSINLWSKASRNPYVFNADILKNVTNVTDRWILSYSQSVINFIHKEISVYRLYTVVPMITEFLDKITNWYIRFNRGRLSGTMGLEDQEIAVTTLFNVLYKMDIIFAPLIPFLTEFIFQHICKYLPTDGLSNEEKEMMKSVHFQILPPSKSDFVDVIIEEAMSNMQTVVNLARVIRDRNTLPVKFPLKEVVVLHKDTSFFEKLAPLEKYITDELNIKTFKSSTDFNEYGLTSTVGVDYKCLGKRLKAGVKVVAEALKSMSSSDLEAVKTKTGSYVVKGHEIFADEITVSYTSNNSQKYSANTDGNVVVLIDITQDDDLKHESIAREIVNRIQKLRKKAGVIPTDEIAVQCWGKNDSVDILNKNSLFLQNAVRQEILVQQSVDGLKLLAKSEEQIDSHSFEFSVYSK